MKEPERRILWLTLATTILVILAGILNGQMDLINFNPQLTGASPDSWWLANNWEAPWIQKTFFSFTLDGWHFVKFLTLNTYFCILLSVYNFGHILVFNNKLRFWDWVLSLIVLNIAHGIGFEISYNWLRG